MRTSTLLAGFALVAMVEVDVNINTPPGLLIPFAIHTAVLIFVHLFSLVIATQLLPELEATINQPCLGLGVTRLAKGWPVQICWFLSNIFGIVLFLVELILVAYVKFYPVAGSSSDRLHVGTGTLLVIILLSLVSAPFVVMLFRSISKHKMQHHEHKLDRAKELLDTINQRAIAGGDMDSESESYHSSGSYERSVKYQNTEV